MSNHFSAANIKFPEDDARLDLTDLFVFAAPDTAPSMRPRRPVSTAHIVVGHVSLSRS